MGRKKKVVENTEVIEPKVIKESPKQNSNVTVKIYKSEVGVSIPDKKQFTVEVANLIMLVEPLILMALKHNYVRGLDVPMQRNLLKLYNLKTGKNKVVSFGCGSCGLNFVKEVAFLYGYKLVGKK